MERMMRTMNRRRRRLWGYQVLKGKYRRGPGPWHKKAMIFKTSVHSLTVIFDGKFPLVFLCSLDPHAPSQKYHEDVL